MSDCQQLERGKRRRAETKECTGCIMENCDKKNSSRCITCRRFYADNFEKIK